MSPRRRRRARVYFRVGCGPVGCSIPLLAALAGIVLAKAIAERDDAR